MKDWFWLVVMAVCIAFNARAGLVALGKEQYGWVIIDVVLVTWCLLIANKHVANIAKGDKDVTNKES